MNNKTITGLNLRGAVTMFKGLGATTVHITYLDRGNDELLENHAPFNYHFFNAIDLEIGYYIAHIETLVLFEELYKWGPHALSARKLQPLSTLEV